MAPSSLLSCEPVPSTMLITNVESSVHSPSYASPSATEKLNQVLTTAAGTRFPMSYGHTPQGAATAGGMADWQPRSVARSKVRRSTSPNATVASPKSGSSPTTEASTGGSSRPQSPVSAAEVSVSGSEVPARFRITSASRGRTVHVLFGCTCPSAKKGGSDR